MFSRRPIASADSCPPIPPPPSSSNFEKVRSRSVKVVLLLLLVVIAGFCVAFGDPLALPTTSEEVVRQDLAALRPAGAVIVKGPASHPYDCGDGPAEAWMTLRFDGDRDHAELEMRRVASQAHWLLDTDTETRERGADLGSFYRQRPMRRSPSFFVDFTVHGSFTDARVETVGELGQKCGVD